MTENESRQIKCFPYAKRFDMLDKYSQRIKTQSKNITNKSNNKKFKSYFFELDKNLNKSDEENNLIKNTKELIESGEKILKDKKLENKFLNKEGTYFISHPKLKYLKSDLNMKTWKTNEIIDSLPKGVLKHKFTSKSQKNHLIVFPSSLNQIMVNLEKLRIHNNFKRIENEFKDNRKK